MTLLKPQTDPRHFLMFATACGLFLVACFLPHLFIHEHFFSAASYSSAGDFAFFWGAPQIARGHIAALFSPPDYFALLRSLHPGWTVNENGLPYAYPLHSLFFYAPFSWLPYVPSMTVWSLGGLLTYGAAVSACAPPKARKLALACALMAPAAILCVLVRQNGLFIGAASLAVLLCLQRNRPIVAGIVLGCLTLKPHLFVLWPLMLLMHRQWRCLLAAGVTTLLLVGTSLAVHGIDAWHDYLTLVPSMQWHYTSWHDDLAEKRNFQLMMPGVVMALRLAGASIATTIAVQCAAGIAVVMGALLAFRHPLPLPLTAILLASGGLLMTPYAYNYDLTLLSAAIALHWLTAPSSALSRWIGLAGFLLAVLVYPLNFSDTPLGPVMLALVFFDAVREARALPLRSKGDS